MITKCSPPDFLMYALEPVQLPTLQEEGVVNAFTADLYVATLDKLSLRGSVTNGFDGHHELVLGGYSQVTALLRSWEGVTVTGMWRKQWYS